MTFKPSMNFEMRKELTQMIQSEVMKQLGPVFDELKAVKVQNTAQSLQLKSIDEWKDKFWGNGKNSGNGYIEKAREEDKIRLDELAAGFARMKTGIEVEKTVTQRVADALSNEASKRERKFTHWIAVLGILAALLGGGLLEHLLNAARVSGH